MLPQELNAVNCKPAPGNGDIHLPLSRYRLRYDAEIPIQMTEFPENAWRGALGHALKRTCCTTHLPVCSSCPEYRRCAYTEIFETPPPLDSAKMRKYLQAPHPFVLEHRAVARGLPRANCRCDLILTLIGRGNAHLALFLKALKEAAENQPGISGNRMRLWRAEREVGLGAERWEPLQADAPSVPSSDAAELIPPLPPSSVEIRLITPLRIKRNGRHVGPAEFHFSDVFSCLLRRVSMLTYFHTSTPLEADFHELVEASRTIKAQATLTWRDLSRYSSRQKAEMRMGGLVGQVQIDGQDVSPFWPYLWLGQWIHAGTGATMGLGRYTIGASLQTTREGSGGATITSQTLPG